ncbi:MAG: TspO/MBR family protein [Allosphingosinicella sp.]|uniref:TspO/MBR family protein n=1 Tax=Allosphingosinicella sp. TaxID=2823234 RepID=UPI00392A9C9F
MTGLASRAQLRMSFLRYALVTVPLVLLLGTLSGQLSNSGYGNRWFDALAKPDFMPPGWMFGVAWTILYILLGLVLAMILHARGAPGRGLALGLFGGQMILNYAWSPLFFGYHQVTAALAVIAAMILLTVLLAVVLWRIRKVAALLLVPYLLWLGFATALTYRIMELNPGAEDLAPEAQGIDIEL